MSAPKSPPPITNRAFAVAQDLMQQDGLDASNLDDVAMYVERLIVRERFFRTIDEAREKTAAIPEDELQQMIDEAVEEVEAMHRGHSAGAAPA